MCVQTQLRNAFCTQELKPRSKSGKKIKKGKHSKKSARKSSSSSSSSDSSSSSKSSSGYSSSSESDDGSNDGSNDGSCSGKSASSSDRKSVTSKTVEHSRKRKRAANVDAHESDVEVKLEAATAGTSKSTAGTSKSAAASSKSAAASSKAAISKFKVGELRDQLSMRGLSTSGLKAELVERLREAM